MKRVLLLPLLSITFMMADASTDAEPEKSYEQYLLDAVESVKKARQETVETLRTLTLPKEDNTTQTPKEQSTTHKIIQTHALGEMAKNTATVEVAKARAISKITQAIQDIEHASPQERATVRETSFATIVQAVASVEIRKAEALKNMLKASHRVIRSEDLPEKPIDHPEETLSIAKNIAAVQIAQSVANVEIERSNSALEQARASLKDLKTPLTPTQEEKLTTLKAQATAKISAYLTKLEVLKAEIATKIAQELANIEITQTQMQKEHQK